MTSKDGKRPARKKHHQGALRLRALRQEMGWSPEVLGVMAGVSGKWIRDIEKSHREPGERVKAQLAKPFGMLPWDIWTPTTSPLSPADIEKLRRLRGDLAVPVAA